MIHRVGMVLHPGFQLLDLAGPMAVFEGAKAAGSPYEMVTLSSQGGLVDSSGGALLDTRPLSAVERLDTILICGGIGAVAHSVDSRLSGFLLEHMNSGARLASVCTGAFIVAHTGLLNGRTVTTHWRFAAELARRFPQVNVEPDRIWVRDHQTWTSAGVTAGIDLALALVEDDFGDAVTKPIARELVVYHRRPGGQSQYSTLLDMHAPTSRFGDLIAWIRENLNEPLHVERLAQEVGMSARNFTRAFLRETGMTPARTVERMRLEVSREWVERATHSLTHIATQTGFGSADRMRLAFVRAFGMPPQAFQRHQRR